MRRPLVRTSSYQMWVLPNVDALFRSQIELSVANVERLVPGVEVADDVGPQLPRRMRIGGELLLQRRLAHLVAPHLAEAQEEALVAGIAADHLVRLAVERQLVGVVGDVEAGEIRHV